VPGHLRPLSWRSPSAMAGAASLRACGIGAVRAGYR
jgi:hypothetical protein